VSEGMNNITQSAAKTTTADIAHMSNVLPLGIEKHTPG